jgi:phenylalanyl-tRNA synthetase beta chain
MKIDKNLIQDVEIFDLFKDPNLGKNKKSMAIKVTMQASDRTLTEDEIQELSSKIVAAIEKSTSGSVRS